MTKKKKRFLSLLKFHLIKNFQKLESHVRRKQEFGIRLRILIIIWSLLWWKKLGSGPDRAFSRQINKTLEYKLARFTRRRCWALFCLVMEHNGIRVAKRGCEWCKKGRTQGEKKAPWTEPLRRTKRNATNETKHRRCAPHSFYANFFTCLFVQTVFYFSFSFSFSLSSFVRFLPPHLFWYFTNGPFFIEIILVSNGWKKFKFEVSRNSRL